MVWQIKIEKKAKKALSSLDFPVQKKIVRYLREKLTEDPRLFGKELVGDMAGLRRYRVENYRIICRLEDHLLIVLVLDIGHRKEIYD